MADPAHVPPAPTTPEPEEGIDSRSVLLFCTLGVLAHLGLSGGRVAVALSSLSQGASSLTVGVLMALFALLPMLLSVHSGRWVDRIGVRRPMRVGAVLLAIGSALPFTIHDTRVYFVSCCFTGIGCMIFQISCQNLIGQRSAPHQRMLNFNRLSLSMSISGFGGPLLVGLVIDNFGSRWAFGLLLLAPIIALFILHRLRHMLPKTVRVASPGAKTASPQVMDLLEDPMVRRVLASTFLLAGAWDLNAFMVPVYGAAIGLSATTIGIILSSFGAATFFIRLMLPWIQARMRPWTLLRTAMFMSGSVYVLYPLFEQVPVLMLLTFVLGCALGSSQASLLSLLHMHAPPGRAAEALGIRMSLINGSQVSLPMLFGVIGTIAGHGLPFWTMAALLLSGGTLTRSPGPEQTRSKRL